MSNFLLAAILTHHNKLVNQLDGLIHAGKEYYNLADNTTSIEWTDVTGYSLQQLKDYLNI